MKRAPALHATAIVACATLSALAAGAGAVGAVRAAVGLHPASALRVPKAADGHYWTTAEVNGRPVRVLVDTGASAVALTPADARRLGLDMDGLDYTRLVITAAGRTAAAPVTLRQVSVAGARVEQVNALVVRAGLDSSLLGMSYLGRLSSFTADRTGLTLTP